MKMFRYSVPLKVYTQYKFGKEIPKNNKKLKVKLFYCNYVKFY